MKMIIPNKHWSGAFIPNWLLEQPNVSANAKLIYAMMCSASTDKGEVTLKQNEMCQRIGVQLRTFQRALSELEHHELINTQSIQIGQPNIYRFPVHKWMENIAPSNNQVKPIENKDVANEKTERLPVNFQLNEETITWSNAIVGQQVTTEQFRKFCEYYWKKSGHRAERSDWNQSFRNWINNAIDWKNVAKLNDNRPERKGYGFARGEQARQERQAGFRSALDKRLASN